MSPHSFRAALVLVGLLLAIQARAEGVVQPLPPKPDSGWTGAGAAFISGGSQTELLEGYLEFGRRLSADTALLGMGMYEMSLGTLQRKRVLSGGVALRLTGDILASIGAPTELSIGVGYSVLLEGTTDAGSGPFILAVVDIAFPVTRYLRIHSSLVEHVNNAGSFLTGGGGIGITFE